MFSVWSKGPYTPSQKCLYAFLHVKCSVVKNIDISISIDTEISERYQY